MTEACGEISFWAEQEITCLFLRVAQIRQRNKEIFEVRTNRASESLACRMSVE